MSNLTIRVRTGFHANIKTIKLCALIGPAGYVYPIRLWAYAAENQPDGDMSKYSDAELDMLIALPGCATSNAISITQALKQCGFIDSDTGLIHDWEEHNGYHAAYAERAKCAANARWERYREKKEKGKTKKKEDTEIDMEKEKETSIACSIAEHNCLNCSEFKDAFARWVVYRKEIRHALKPSTIKMQLTFLEKLGKDNAILSIDQSIEKGWQGLFEPAMFRKSQPPNGKPVAPRPSEVDWSKGFNQ